MVASRFNFYVRDFPSTGSTLVYNSLTGAFAELEVEGDQAIEAALAEDASLADDDAGFVVASEHDDERRFRDWYDGMRADTSSISGIVSVTFACNFECTYCCQADVLDGHTMTAETAVAAGRWYGERAKEIGARLIDLAFIGGEPLLAIGRIEDMARAIRAAAGEGVEFKFTLVTNGLFLTRAVVERLLPLGLVAAQVTFDGDATTHHLTRVSKRGEDTFATIFANVLAVKDLIEIRINGNYTSVTLPGFPGLIEQLRAAGLPDTSQVSLRPALDGLGAPEASGMAGNYGEASPRSMFALNDAVRAAGFKASDLLALGPCGFHRHHNYGLDPDGNLYKCPAFIGKTNWAIGDVRNGLSSRYRKMIDSHSLQSCGSCGHRPHCGGACVASEWLRRDREEGLVCEKSYFDEHQDAAIKRKYSAALVEAEGGDPFALEPRLELADTLTRPGGAVRSTALRVVA